MENLPGEWPAHGVSLDVAPDHSPRMRHMDDLPDEWFTQILDHVPIREIYVLMRVSKRWAAACRFIVRTRRSLFIIEICYYRKYVDVLKISGCDWHRNRPSKKLDNVGVSRDLLMPAMMKSLNQMENITRLCVYDITLPGICPFIQKFADQLTLLEVDMTISQSFVGSAIFPNLTHLYCDFFDTKSSAAFPKLAELVIHQSCIFLDREDEKKAGAVGQGVAQSEETHDYQP